MSINASLKVVRFAVVVNFAALCLLVSSDFAIAQRGADDPPPPLLAQARALVEAGELAEAINAYKRLVAISPSNSQARRELAGLLMRSPATRLAAENVLKEASLLSPADFGLAMERAANLLAIGDTVNAALEYRRAFEIAPHSRPAIDGYVKQVQRLGAGPVAIKQHAKALAKTSSDLAARLLLAELLRSEARYNDAIEQFNLVLRREPANELARAGVAEALLALGRYDQAVESFRQSPGKTAAQEDDRSLDFLARVHLAEARPEAALLLLLRAQPVILERSAIVLGTLAETYRVLGRTQSERQVLEKLPPPVSTEDASSALARLARIRFEMGDKEAARAACEQLFAADPRSAIAALGLKLLGLPSSNAPLVELKITTPARQSGFDGEAGEAALFWNKPDLALPGLRSAVAARPDSPRLLLSLGAALQRTNQTQEAIKAFAHVAVSEGRRPDALLGWAEAELANDKPLKAIEVYNDMLRLDPANFRAQFGLAESFSRAGDVDRAALLLINLSRRAPESRSVNARLRDLLSARGRSFRTNPLARAQLLVANSSATLAPLTNRDAALDFFQIEPLLQAGDVINVTMSGRMRHSAVVTLDDEGRLRLPFLKEPLSANCLTERELGAALLKQGDDSLRSSAVEVSLAKMQRPPLVVGGAVYLPNGYRVRTALDLREALMLASGANNRAGRSVYIVRGAGAISEEACGGATAINQFSNQLEVYERAAVEAGNIESSQKVGAGDLIFVPERDSAVIAGAVGQTGFVSVLARPTLSQTIKNAGGTLDGADRSRVVLRRLLPQGTSYQQFIVNLTDIDEQRVGDVILQPGDVIEIPSTKTNANDHQSVVAVLRRLAFSQQSPSTDIAPRTIITAEPAAKIKEKQ